MYEHSEARNVFSEVENPQCFAVACPLLKYDDFKRDNRKK